MEHLLFNGTIIPNINKMVVVDIFGKIANVYVTRWTGEVDQECPRESVVDTEKLNQSIMKAYVYREWYYRICNKLVYRTPARKM